MHRPVITPLLEYLEHKGRPGLGLSCDTKWATASKPVGALGERLFLNLEGMVRLLGNR